MNRVIQTSCQWQARMESSQALLSPLMYVCAQTPQALCNPIDCIPPGSSVHEIFQARILEWVAISSSRGSSRPRDQTCVSCIAGGFFPAEPLGKPHYHSHLQSPLLLAKDGYLWTTAAICQDHSPQHYVLLSLHLRVWITWLVSSASDTVQVALLDTGHLLSITFTLCKSLVFLPLHWGLSTLCAWWSQSNHCGHSFVCYKTLPCECTGRYLKLQPTRF